jgi:AraC family transcriptional regulator of adaptative response/methylated-DNA-[protein]-cysteine methyltransferase
LPRLQDLAWKLEEFESNLRSAPHELVSHPVAMNQALRTVSKKSHSANFDGDDERWAAVQRRDARADGKFVYSVATTGVYCRPTCSSRLALRKNVAFHDTPADAARAGFRPCRRCHPDGPSQKERHADAAARACRIIDAAEAPPGLRELASAVGLSRFHFQRIFKEAVGVTPRQYAAARRSNRVKSELRSNRSVTEAIYGAGFGSSSRFYERSATTLGMTPSQFRDHGSGVTIRYSIHKCSLGFVLIAGTGKGICAIRFDDDSAVLERELRRDFSQASIEKGTGAFQDWVQAIVRQIEKPGTEIKLPLDIRGTAFQQRVWQALREIPRGKTASYADVAARIGQPSAVRAVAGACAANPVAVIVPCHRVVRSDGHLSGYRWGADRKRKLLEREGARI